MLISKMLFVRSLLSFFLITILLTNCKRAYICTSGPCYVCEHPTKGSIKLCADINPNTVQYEMADYTQQGYSCKQIPNDVWEEKATDEEATLLCHHSACSCKLK